MFAPDPAAALGTAVDCDPEIRSYRRGVLRAVRSPTVQRVVRADEFWFHLRSAGPSRSLKVVVFDQVAYDEDANVLYLHAGDPSTATDFAEAAEGHAIRLGASGRVVGLTLLRPRYHLEKGHPIAVTVPASARIQIDRSALRPVVHAA